MKNNHWACAEIHKGVGISPGNHNAKWGCAVAPGHEPRKAPHECAQCRIEYRGRPRARQYAPTFHYDCSLASWEHNPPGRRGALGGHRAGCPTKVGHEGGAGQECYGCRVLYLGHESGTTFLGKFQNHPHYACALTPLEHGPARGVGRGHRPGCAVAEGHDAGPIKPCHACGISAHKPQKMRAAGLARFGLTTRDYETMLAVQGGGCAICGKSSSNGKNLAVDHDHGSGAVRGLLCHNCNVAIGSLRDDPTLLRRAADYLETRVVSFPSNN